MKPGDIYLDANGQPCLFIGKLRWGGEFDKDKVDRLCFTFRAIGRRHTFREDHDDAVCKVLFNVTDVAKEMGYE